MFESKWNLTNFVMDLMDSIWREMLSEGSCNFMSLPHRDKKWKRWYCITGIATKGFMGYDTLFRFPFFHHLICHQIRRVIRYQITSPNGPRENASGIFVLPRLCACEFPFSLSIGMVFCTATCSKWSMQCYPK